MLKNVGMYKGCNGDCFLLKGDFQNISICETQVCLNSQIINLQNQICTKINKAEGLTNLSLYLLMRGH